MMAKLKIYQPEMIKGKLIMPAPVNPNEMPPETFNSFVQTMEEDGFTESISVVPIASFGAEFADKYPDKQYVLRSGEHRWRAAMVLDEEAELPTVVVPLAGNDVDVESGRVVRSNALRGDLNAQQVTLIYKQLKGRYGHEQAVQMMGLSNDRVFKRMVQQAREILPEDLRRSFDQSANKLETVDDVAALVQALYKVKEEDLALGYLVFASGGKLHVMIPMNERLKKIVDGVIEECRARSTDVRHVMARMIVEGWDVLQEHAFEAYDAS